MPLLDRVRSADVTVRTTSLAAIVAALVATVRAWHTDLDDGEIVDRYVSNLLHGHGWVFNPGETLNACTSTLHPLLVVLGAVFLPSSRDASHVVGGLSLAVAGAAAARLMLQAELPPAAALAAAVLVPTCLPLGTTWGLETQLLLALLLLGCVVRQGGGGWTVRSLAALTRPDLGVWIPLTFIRDRLVDKRWSIRGAVLALGPLVVVGIVAWIVYGSPTPASLGNKVDQGKSAAFSAESYRHVLPIALKQTLYSRHASELAWVLAAWGLATAWFRRLDGLLELTAVVVVDQLAFAVLKVPGYPWYYAPLQTLILLLAIVGVADVLQRVTTFATGMVGNAKAVGALAAAAGLIGGLAVLGTDLRHYPHGLGDREKTYLALVADLKADPPHRLVAAEVGVVGYALGPQTAIVDFVGLVSHPAYYLGRDNDRFFADPPDAVIIHDRNGSFPYEDGIYEDPRFATTYELRKVYQVGTYVKVELWVRRA